MEKGSKRKKNADEDRRDGPHVSLPWSSECIYFSVNFKFLPRTIFFIREFRHIIARQYFSIYLYDMDNHTQNMHLVFIIKYYI